MRRWSIRARLALWYAGAFAVLLAVVATLAYLFLADTTAARVDGYLGETADAVADALATALAGSRDRVSADARTAAVLREFRFRDIGIAVFDAGVSEARLAAPAPTAPSPPVLSRRRKRVRQPRRAPVPEPVAIPVPDSPATTGAPRFALLAANAADPRGHGFGGDDTTSQRRAALVAARAARGGATTVETVETGDDAERVLATPVAAGGRALVVGVSQSLREQTAALDEARTALVLGLPVALLLATAGGYALARKSLSPVDAMAARAAHIGAGTLHERLPAPRADDELGRLAAVFNSLLERLDQSFQRQRQFMADASHELRTPVAIVRGEAELALSKPARAEPEYRAALSTVGHEARRLSQIVNDLFLLARAEAGDRPLFRTSLYLEELVGDCVSSVRTLAADRQITVHYSPEAELPFAGDEKLLRRLVVNLLDNAIKYTPVGGRVDVELAPSAEGPVTGARLVVRDTGRGIPPEDRDRVFERFYRVQAGDGSVGDGSGAGLGLPIAAWVAQAHGGRLTLAESGPEGTTFVAELPGRGKREAGSA